MSNNAPGPSFARKDKESPVLRRKRAIFFIVPERAINMVTPTAAAQAVQFLKKGINFRILANKRNEVSQIANIIIKREIEIVLSMPKRTFIINCKPSGTWISLSNASLILRDKFLASVLLAAIDKFMVNKDTINRKINIVPIFFITKRRERHL